MVDHREKETQIDESLARETLERSADGRRDDGVPPRDPSAVDLGERYQVRELLGQGGMGAVLLARDLELDRDVAVKLIRDDLADRPEVLARFRREVQLASQVTHPNVLRVYDLGESSGQRFLTMQFVDGEDLGAVIKRDGPLEVARAVALFRQMASALAAAHERGVVHRDLKPQNVLVDEDGAAFVADFGLASSAATTSDDVRITRTGVAIGTPLYMAPEQVAGSAADERSDLYALGLIFYEMLTGRLPFEGDTPLSVMTQRLSQEPVPLTRWRTDAPPYLRQLLERCLQREPSLRYQSADEVLRDLDAGRVERPVLGARRLWPIAAGLLLVGMLVALYFGLGLRREDVDDDEPLVDAPAELVPLIAIAPFNNLTGDESLDWLETALPRLVRDDLSQSRHVRVLSEQRSEELVGSERALDRDQALAQGVTALLSADLLVDNEDGLVAASRTEDLLSSTQLASRRVEGETTAGLLTAMTQVAASVRRALELPASEEVNLLSVDYAASNPESYASFVEGSRAYTEFRYDEAERALRSALDRSPDFVMARYRLSQVLADVSRTDEARAEIERARRESARLGEREQLYIEAQDHLIARRNEESIKTLRRLLSAFPYETEARYLLAIVLMNIGRNEESQEELQVLNRLDPRDATVWSMLGYLELQLRDFPGAVTKLRRFAELESGSPNAHELLGDAYAAQGEMGLAAASYRRALELEPTFWSSVIKLATVDYLAGRPREAVAPLEALSRNETVRPRARIDAALGVASILRATSQFRRALTVLEDASPLAEAEGPRWALVLSLRGLCSMELGEMESAARLINRAIAESPGVASRYLFARGLLELRSGDLDAVSRTASAIQDLALPPEDPDRTEDKAAAYLRGRLHLARDQPEMALESLTTAVTGEGYEYALYRAALAAAFHRLGRLDDALASARSAVEQRDTLEPRIDLDLGRVRARLLLAEIQEELGDLEASEEARRLVFDLRSSTGGLFSLQSEPLLE